MTEDRGERPGNPVDGLGAGHGRALSRVLLFGLGMAVVTVLWSAGTGAGDAMCDAVDLLS